jgi:hypothetical protein
VSFALFYKGELIVKAYNFSFEVADDDQLPATASFTLRHLRDGGEPSPPSRFGQNSTGTSQPKAFHDAENKVDYNEMRVTYQKRKADRGELPVGATRLNPDDYDDVVKIVFRAFNDGIAYRYEIATKAEETITIKNENVEFVFPDDYRFDSSADFERFIEQHGFSRALINAWRMSRKTLSNMARGTASILNIEAAPRFNISLGEISHAGFARLQFQPGRERTGTFSNLYERFGNIDRTGKMTAVAMFLDGDTEIPGTGEPYRTPWRVIAGPPADNENGESDLFRSLQTPEPVGGREPIFTFSTSFPR